MIDLEALVRRTGEALEGSAAAKFPPIPPDENKGSGKRDDIAEDRNEPSEIRNAAGRAQCSLSNFGGNGEIGGKPCPATDLLSPNRLGAGEIGERIACSPDKLRAGGKLLDLRATRRGPWWNGPAWDEPGFSVGIMAEWQLGLQRLSSHREPCPGFRSGQWLRVYEIALRFLAEHGPSAADLGWLTLDLFGVDPGVGVARVSCCGALMVSGGSPAESVTTGMIRHRKGLAFRKCAAPDPSIAVWDYAWPEAAR
jgi:hypothetical protein